MASEEGVVIACHTKAEFDAQMAKAKEVSKLVIIDITASWCGPCCIIAPVFVELAKKFTQDVFLKVDVDKLKEVTEDYKIQVMPMFLFIKNGETVETIIGARKDNLQDKILKHAAPVAASASA